MKEIRNVLLASSSGGYVDDHVYSKVLIIECDLMQMAS